mmetsp:Transcript_9000/g.16322  ORF Transcript_9000/g.16322 Transcript_9000/m.16322 type:complete len:122 (+) Transcript_9000:53-418(+)|eukprot:CAMPEP_0182499568 /NCGR_PEP_ID=MMETSP1321-20130603/7833_1 /TAXON_ID=91990 /ORGANISM="Bolidomonas sp., Strain RCC1657" /LENGTH=121 /DNA_ID=CAMNT_0024703791 /DNA_START=53 /DNA_END=415 /DNA_ORIENTATION=+
MDSAPLGVDEIPEGFTAAPGGTEGAQKAAERQAQVESILDQILDGPAKDRLSRIKLVKKAKATQIENQLVQMAMSGKLQGKINEKALCEMLEGTSVETKVKIDRRNYGIDSDEDDNDDDLW